MCGYDPSADIVRIAEAVENAPSVLNTRPWSLSFSAADRIELRLPASWGKPGDKARTREYVISSGAALY